MARPTLVTGAAGFAGGHLLDLLLADGVETFGWYRPGGIVPPAVPGLTWQAVEMLDREAVHAAIESARPAVVYHCAGAANVGSAWHNTTDTLRINVLGTHHLIDAVRAIVPDARVLVTSSALVYAPSDQAIGEDHPLRPANPYGLSKLAQELAACGNGDRPVTYIARPFNHFGPRQESTFVSAAFARQIAEIEAGLLPPEIRVGNLEPRRDLTDVRDTVRAYRLMIERGSPGRPYNVCSGQAIAVRALLEMLLSRAAVAISIVADPERYRPNDTPVVLGEPSRAAAELGWTASIPLERTADDLLEYWRARVRQQ
jgi:GDP-4-dehydro-6-deoxy-D-mannose reductase